MASKRQAPDDTASRSSSSRKRHKPNTNPHLARPNHGKNSFKKAHVVNDLKSTIRSLERLLSRNDKLPAGVRVEKERALQTAQRDLQKEQRAKDRSEVISKWHKVRFFERQKAERRLKRARKGLEELRKTGAEGKDVERKVEEVKEYEVEVAYAIYFPLERGYVPLFRSLRADGERHSTEAEEEVNPAKAVERYGDKEMWEEVKRCMQEGKLEDLREGRLNAAKHEDEQQDFPTRSVKKVRRENIKEDADEGMNTVGGDKPEARDEDESGDESGGAFFE